MFLSQTIASSSARSRQSWPVVDQGEAKRRRGGGGAAEIIQEPTAKIVSELEWAGGRRKPSNKKSTRVRKEGRKEGRVPPNRIDAFHWIDISLSFADPEMQMD